MAIFTWIGTAIAGFLFAGSALAAKVIATALAFGTKLALSYLGRGKRRAYSAVSGQVEYGGRVPVSTAYGIVKTAGHRIGYFKWGRGNKFNADVFVLANGWCDGLEEEVHFYGAKHDLVERPIIGNEVAHFGVAGFDNLISIRFYDGRPGQQADMKLVNDTASLTRKWKATSACTAQCYVVIERQWSAEKFDKGRPNFEFVLRGLRLYDPRKDDTIAGGSGTHRLDDPATYEFGDTGQNPALQRLNYQLGLRGRISHRTLIGEGKTLGQLDLGSYFAAMNVCDTMRAGKPTFQCALIVNAEDDHTEILREFDDAMAGYALNRRGLSGVIPGAPQIPVATITADDIPAGRQQELRRRKNSFSLYNHLSGQFTSPEKMWQPESLKPIHVNADVAADGRPRQTSNDFLQVTDADIAQYLLTIRYRQQRLGGSAKVPVSRRLGFRVMEGEWIAFDGKSWLVTGWSCDNRLRVTLTLAETSPEIYDDSEIAPGPIVIPSPPPVNPGLLSTVQDFSVEVGQIDGGEGHQVPALRFKWTPPEDPTITAVRFEYFRGSNPTGQTIYLDRTEDVEAGEYLTSKDVQPYSFYTARATITTMPDRFKSFTAWFTTVSSTGPVEVFPPGLREEMREFVEDATEWSGRSLRELLNDARRLVASMLDQSVTEYEDREAIREEVKSSNQNAKAYADLQILAATGPNSALSLAMMTAHAELRGKASGGAVLALTTRVDAHDDDLEVISQALLDVYTELDEKASTNSVLLLQGRVEDVEGDVTALSDAVLAVEAQVDDVSANGSFRVQAGASPGDSWVRLGMHGSADNGVTVEEAAIWVDVRTTGTIRSRVGVKAQQFFLSDGTDEVDPFVFQDGIAYIENIRAGDIIFNKLRAADGKMVLSGMGGTYVDVFA